MLDFVQTHLLRYIVMFCQREIGKRKKKLLEIVESIN